MPVDHVESSGRVDPGRCGIAHRFVSAFGQLFFLQPDGQTERGHCVDPGGSDIPQGLVHFFFQGGNARFEFFRGEQAPSNRHAAIAATPRVYPKPNLVEMVVVIFSITFLIGLRTP